MHLVVRFVFSPLFFAVFIDLYLHSYRPPIFPLFDEMIIGA